MTFSIKTRIIEDCLKLLVFIALYIEHCIPVQAPCQQKDVLFLKKYKGALL